MLFASAFTDTLPVLLVLIGFTVVGGVLLFFIRKRLKSVPSETTTYSLSQLQTMLANGTIKQEEFDMAKKSIIRMHSSDDRYLDKSDNLGQKERKHS